MKSLIIFVFILMSAAAAAAQEKLPVINSSKEVISIRDGLQLKENGWRLAPEAKPDVYEAELINGEPHDVTFITEADSITFKVEEGKKYDFIVKYGDKLCYTQIVGKRFIPAAVFDEKYREMHRGRTFVEIPEVYELVNIAIALTPTAIEDAGLIYKNSQYYSDVRASFDKHSGHPFVAALEKELKENRDRYFSLKMNGYAFEFDENGRIQRSKIYDRTGFSGQRSNTLLPYLDLMRSFAAETNFREFFRRHKKTYDDQVAFYRDTADLAEMKRWLDRNFPGSSDYDTYKIVFSPLVAYNQSVTWFESNGFKELQPHVNFPYAEDLSRVGEDFKKLSPSSRIIFRGNIVFTEMNHGYLNPESDKYGDRVAKAVSNRDLWVDPKMGSNYYPGSSTFNEYMNWALVSLRIVDYADKADQDIMIAAVERMMTERRGFPKFAEFDRFLVDLYRTRKKGQTVADLFPEIITWFEKQNAAKPN